MNGISGCKWMRLVSVVSLLCCAAVFCGCGESEDTSTSITPTRFAVDRELRNYSDTDEFAWDTTLNQALMTVRINDFTEGDTAVRVYDGRGSLILAATLNTLDSSYFNGNDFYFQKRTDIGVSGQWRIVLDYNDFSGDISITLE